MRLENLTFLDQKTLIFIKKYLPVVILFIIALSTFYLFSRIPKKIPCDPPAISNLTSNEPWDTFDGLGYQFEQKEEEPLDPRYEELNSLPYCGSLSSTDLQTNVTSLIEKVKNDFYKCITPIVAKWKDRAQEMNVEWVSKAAVCDKLPIFKELNIVEFKNLHEIKWAVLPKCKEENVLVTLGVGHDTIAEELLNRTIPNTKFYGADPIIEPNRQMYSAFGKFFPFAIGKVPGFTKFRVLPNQTKKTRRYFYQDVSTIPFLYFVNDILKLEKIDFAWFDIEGGEFEFLDQLHDGVRICQFNIEVHSKFMPYGIQVFHDFIFKVLEDKKYIFLHSLHTDIGVHRMFFLNVQDHDCLAKFYNQFS